MIRAAAAIAGGAAAWALAAVVLPRGLPPGIVLLGLVFGSLYALLAVALVLVFRASGVLNFAQADLGAIAAVLAVELVVTLGWPYPVAVVAGLVLAVTIGTVVDVAVVRRLARAPRFLVAVATLGVGQVLAGASILLGLAFGGQRATRLSTPFGGATAFVRPVVFTGDHLAVLVAVPLALAALMWFLQRTSYGIAIRAASDRAERAIVLGVPVQRLSTIVWALAAVLSVVVVMLRVPLLGYVSSRSISGAGESLLLRTLGAALLGRMHSLPRTVIAALALGVVQEGASWNLSNTDHVDAVLVLVVLAALLSQQRFYRSIVDARPVWRTIREVRSIPAELRWLPEVRWAFGGLRLALLAVAVSLPLWVPPSVEQAAGLVVVTGIAAVSLLVLTGWGGHVSLGQWALVGFGAATTAFCYGRLGTDALPALIAGALVSAAVCVLVGLPALETSGPYMAVTTLTFAVASSYFFLEDRYLPWFITQDVPPASLLGLVPLTREWQSYLFALGVLLAVLYGVRNLRRTRTGRALIAIRDNAAAAQTVSLNPVRVKLGAFAISGAIAGLAGGVYVLQQRSFTTSSFSAGVSLSLFTMVVIGGLGSVPGVLLGVLYVKGAQAFLPGGWSIVASGAGVVVLLVFLPDGLGAVLFGIRDAYLRWVARRRGIAVPSLQPVASRTDRPTIRFDGRVA